MILHQDQVFTQPRPKAVMVLTCQSRLAPTVQIDIERYG